MKMPVMSDKSWTRSTFQRFLASLKSPRLVANVNAAVEWLLFFFFLQSLPRTDLTEQLTEETALFIGEKEKLRAD